MTKNILFFFFVLFTGHTYSMESLNNGACWVGEENSQVKVASFNEGVSFALDSYALSGFEGVLSQNNLHSSEIEQLSIGVHCSGLGARIVFNVTINEKSYCVWSRVSNGQVVYEGLDYSEFDNGKCDGYLRNKLLVSVVDPTSKTALAQMIVEQYQGVDFEILDSHNVVVSFHGDVEVEKVKSELELNQKIKYVEYSYRYRPIGEYREITDLLK